MSEQAAVRLKVPHQDLDQSSYFELSAAGIDRWVDGLPKANLGQMAKQIYQAVSELSRVRMLPPQRQEVLETLHKPIHYITGSLAKHYLNQPLVLPDKAQQVARLCEALHQHLATGHRIVIAHAAALDNQNRSPATDDLIALSIGRAISSNSTNLLRYYQLFQPTPEQCWSQLHQLYQLAQQRQLIGKGCSKGGDTISQQYGRALLLHCCQPNQLQQSQLNSLYEPLLEWADKINIGVASPLALFSLDVNGDHGPRYKKDSDGGCDLDCSDLVTHLEQLISEGSATFIKIGDQSLPKELLKQLIANLGAAKERRSRRFDCDEHLDICVGINTTHHFIAGELSFEALLSRNGYQPYSLEFDNPFLKAQTRAVHQKDVWDSPYESNVGNIDVTLESIQYGSKSRHEEASKEGKDKYQHHQALVLNSSATGYCIQWPERIPGQMKAGEVVGIRQGKSSQWSIGVIRWIRQTAEKIPQLGIELLCPNGSPYGARVVQKTGENTSYLRTMVLPEIPAIKQPLTLLTPSVPFKEGQKVLLNQQGKELAIRLVKKLNLTGAYCQFTFQKLGGAATEVAKTKHSSNSGFEALWDNL